MFINFKLAANVLIKIFGKPYINHLVLGKTQFR